MVTQQFEQCIQHQNYDTLLTLLACIIARKVLSYQVVGKAFSYDTEMC